MSDRPDIEAAKKKMRAKLGAGREIKKLPEYLYEGEIVERMSTGAYGKGTGLLVLTDRRLLFVQDGVLSKSTEDFPFSKVSSVQWSSGLALGTIIIYASGNRAEIKNVAKQDGKEITDLIRERMHSNEVPGVPTPAAAPAAPAPDVMQQLKQLGELRDAGVLTPEEFDTKKADLLARM